MVAEAVAAALAHRGFAATMMQWPTEQAEARAPSRCTLRISRPDC